jgi:hypothetical protein
MHKQLAVPLVVGLVVVALAVAGIVYMQRGAHIELKGSILKVRTVAMEETSSLAVLDFRFANPADYPFVVRTVEVFMEDAQGNRHNSVTVSEVDAKRLFEYFPRLGQKHNVSLLMRDSIKPHSTEDRMIAARFDMPESKLESRKRFIVRVEEVDGVQSEMAEK